MRVLYQGEALEFSKWDYVTVISYQEIPELREQGFSETRKNIANIYLDESKSDEEILSKFSRNTRN